MYNEHAEKEVPKLKKAYFKKCAEVEVSLYVFRIGKANADVSIICNRSKNVKITLSRCKPNFSRTLSIPTTSLLPQPLSMTLPSNRFTPRQTSVLPCSPIPYRPAPIPLLCLLLQRTKRRPMSNRLVGIVLDRLVNNSWLVERNLEMS